jgi:hypothetical protein
VFRPAAVAERSLWESFRSVSIRGVLLAKPSQESMVGSSDGSGRLSIILSTSSTCASRLSSTCLPHAVI